MFKRIDHVELIPSDAEKSIDFYVNVLDFKIKSRFPLDMPPVKEIIFIELGDTVMEIISVDKAGPKSQDTLTL